ncbi:hypothetical protein FZI85_04600 [Mycobacterium sp. CBMA293]|uniref:hypothetical protein n=1 Tax=unclassified Mycolicibacterium TaxID=2636767 RepID=UPI0012DCAFE7|nr:MULTISPECIES: hypothetical protein [unclassified Mycolicibacterium]MUL48993.1 hypothetical protein [Mycolicibacterium sp. CBMA 360]MUL58592.1 hypothetical protein [Mycolicibacterium sp. CBMA 335]MUL74050.1 hypothetical protein [Mycolicibacterium sp. CBMA 311]MUL93475.1 hypothetical protein [Mycolicibacterium sp. CBMA 230]MUM04694.1 hypothetical protein [Mycolicibacterium sp. CBMA 213]
MITNRNIKKLVGKALLSGGLTLAGLGLASGTAQAFNPQPEPPGKPINVSVTPRFTSPGTIRGFNPTPEPPKVVTGVIGACDGSV